MVAFAKFSVANICAPLEHSDSRNFRLVKILVCMVLQMRTHVSIMHACIILHCIMHACMHACVHYILFAFCCIDNSECQEKRALMLIVLLLPVDSTIF